MKRLLLFLLLLPQLSFSQYRGQGFCLDSDTGYNSERMGCTLSRDTVIDLGTRNSIFGLSLSGQAILGQEDSYIRVLLVDDYNYEYLVYDTYPLLAGEDETDFTNTALETTVLEGVVPHQLRVQMKNATLRIDALNYRTTPSNSRDAFAVQQQQAQYIADKLNENLRQRNMTWRAKVTSMSTLSYEDKKSMFGGNVPQMYGWEHYAGGIFVMPGATRTANRTASNYASEWDWRNRHGRNWMTPVKNQGSCSSCWAFGAIGALEAYVNLYFNNTINYKLSEQEIITCTNKHCHACDVDTAFNYIRNNGVVLDSCFTYTATTRTCNEKCTNPIETISIDDFGISPCIEDSIKKHVHKSPITIGATNWRHIMTLVGYKFLALGDTIFNGSSSSIPPIIISNNNQNLISQTAWLIKNSFGDSWGNAGYGYVVIDSSNLAETLYIKGAVHSQLFTDEDVILEDRDGDGYFFWGIGPKPANCPSWIPDIPDGDDSNVDIGQLDEFGNYNFNETIIKSDTTYSAFHEEHLPVNIVNGGTLRITGYTYLMSSSRIRVCNGGELIIDGGILDEADIFLMPGSKLIIKNNGTLRMGGYRSLEIPVGVILEIEEGKIIEFGNS